MHEFSICSNLVQVAIEETILQGGDTARIKKVKMVVGELRQIVPDHMQFAFETFTKDTIAAGASLELEVLPALGRCHECKWDGHLKDVLTCPECKSGPVSVEQGKELHLDGLRIEVED